MMEFRCKSSETLWCKPQTWATLLDLNQARTKKKKKKEFSYKMKASIKQTTKTVLWRAKGYAVDSPLFKYVVAAIIG